MGTGAGKPVLGLKESVQAEVVTALQLLTKVEGECILKGSLSITTSTYQHFLIRHRHGSMETGIRRECFWSVQCLQDSLQREGQWPGFMQKAARVIVAKGKDAQRVFLKLSEYMQDQTNRAEDFPLDSLQLYQNLHHSLYHFPRTLFIHLSLNHNT